MDNGFKVALQGSCQGLIHVHVVEILELFYGELRREQTLRTLHSLNPAKHNLSFRYDPSVYKIFSLM